MGEGPLAPAHEFLAWLATADSLIPVSLDLEPEQLGPEVLAPPWPSSDLAAAHDVVVGVGSIGSAA